MDWRWLELAVRCPAGSGGYIALDPRQAVNPTPYALALPGLWTRSGAESPNLIGGYSGNLVTSRKEGKQVFYATNHDNVVQCCGQLTAKFDTLEACEV